MREDLLELAFQHDEMAELDPAERRLALRELLLQRDEEDTISALTEIADAIDGFGPLTSLMEDETVTDVLVNGAGQVWVERNGKLAPAETAFRDPDGLREWIDRMLALAGGRIDAARPIADARLPDGSRMHAVLPPVAPGGPLVSIRKWPSLPLTLDELHEMGMTTAPQLEFLRGAVRDERTMAISGGTGSGKTTLLNALLGEVPTESRVVVLEETPELRPRCDHHVSLLTRGENVEGAGAIDLGDLVRASLRMRPDRIIVGEVRGAEALAALAAMSVGHEGSMVTVHARSARAAPERLVSLALLAGSGARPESLRRQISDAFDFFVHLERTAEGNRKVAEIRSSREEDRPLG